MPAVRDYAKEDEVARGRVKKLAELRVLLNKPDNPKRKQHLQEYEQCVRAQAAYEHSRMYASANISAGDASENLLKRVGPVTFDFTMPIPGEPWLKTISKNTTNVAPVQMPLTVGTNGAAMVVRPAKSGGNAKARWVGSQPMRVMNNGVWRDVEVSVTVLERTTAAESKSAPAPNTNKSNKKKKKSKGTAQATKSGQKEQQQQQQQQQQETVALAPQKKKKKKPIYQPKYTAFTRSSSYNGNGNGVSLADLVNPWEHDLYDHQHRSPRATRDAVYAGYARSPGDPGYAAGYGGYERSAHDSGYARYAAYPRSPLDYDVQMAEPSPALTAMRAYTPPYTATTGRGPGAVHPSRMGLVPGTENRRYSRESSWVSDGRRAPGRDDVRRGDDERDRPLQYHEPQRYSPALRSPSVFSLGDRGGTYDSARYRELSEELLDVPDSPIHVSRPAAEGAVNGAKRKRSETPEEGEIENDIIEPAWPDKVNIQDREIKKLRTACRA